ncbi:MogA/MoaB family molybdenum cofactor biosynthesis protein [Corynebacterium cystitidis]|uniref:Molybdenum cofactor synthesis domain-containing protein n=1 Tax=Corynebacterium cystitidis DSM 20524 TaxID=1121357 RepID=A0A1H9U6L6_9CORY|nr:MogA/MoaB family molybdenum cofactor biosynthesis protein [Corynebacterium cystitidis]WJY81199.1 Molybdenum cofactor biosynthesis protein B [Corynebacterium cystitidis DSM 20524]SES04962.1 molybdenum cofactor synthesis domain-containing protein [Corynebacterium cystitidis DSM 20524]SNV89491.1 competence-damage inducible protein [Corynebacterium cystitidis]
MRTGLVIVSSTRASQGVYEDKSGPIAVEFLRSQGYDTPDALVVADKDMKATIDEVFSRSELPNVILTSGGTGITPDDRTVEHVTPYIEREIPGIVYAFWNEGMKNVPTAVISRAVAGVTGQTFVMTLPGSRGGVKDGCAVLEPLLVHISEMLEGKHEH